MAFSRTAIIRHSLLKAPIVNGTPELLTEKGEIVCSSVKGNRRRMVRRMIKSRAQFRVNNSAIGQTSKATDDNLSQDQELKVLRSFEFGRNRDVCLQLYDWIRDRPQEFQKLKEKLLSDGEEKGKIDGFKRLREVTESLAIVFKKQSELGPIANSENENDDLSVANDSSILPLSIFEALCSSSELVVAGSQKDFAIAYPILNDILKDQSSRDQLKGTISELVELVREKRLLRSSMGSNQGIVKYFSRLREFLQINEEIKEKDITDVLDAERVWNFLRNTEKALNVPVTREALNSLMKMSLDEGKMDLAARCFSYLISARLTPNGDTFLQILRKHILCREYESVELGLLKMKKLSVPITDDFALQVLKEFLVSVRTNPELERKRYLGLASPSFRVRKMKGGTSLVELFPALDKTPEMMVHRVFYLLQEQIQMRKENFRKTFLPIECYEVIMEICAHQYMAERSLRYYRELLKAGLVPTSKIFLSLLQCLSTRSDFAKEFWVVVQQAEAEGHVGREFTEAVIDSACRLSGNTGNISSCLSMFHYLSNNNLKPPKVNDDNIEDCNNDGINELDQRYCPYSASMYRSLFISILNSIYYESIKLEELYQRWKHVFNIRKDLAENYFTLNQNQKDENQDENQNQKDEDENQDENQHENQNQDENQDENQNENQQDENQNQHDFVKEGEISLQIPPVKKMLVNDYFSSSMMQKIIQRKYAMTVREMIKESILIPDRRQRLQHRNNKRLLWLSDRYEKEKDPSVLDAVGLNTEVPVPPIIKTLEDGTKLKIQNPEARIDPAVKEYHRENLLAEAHRLNELSQDMREREERLQAMISNSHLKGCETPSIFEMSLKVINDNIKPNDSQIKNLTLITNDDLALFDSWEELEANLVRPSAKDKLDLALKVWKSYVEKGNRINNTILDDLFAIYCMFEEDIRKVKKFFKKEYNQYARVTATARTFALAMERAHKSPLDNLQWARSLVREFESSLLDRYKGSKQESFYKNFYSTAISVFAANDCVMECDNCFKTVASRGMILKKEAFPLETRLQLEQMFPQFGRIYGEEESEKSRRRGLQDPFNFNFSEDGDAKSSCPSSSSSHHRHQPNKNTEKPATFASPYTLPSQFPVLASASKISIGNKSGKSKNPGTAESIRRNERVCEVMEKIYGPVLSSGYRQFVHNDSKMKKYDRTGLNPDSHSSIRCFDNQ